MDPATVLDASTLSALVTEARQRTQALVADLSDEELMGPRLPIVNPLRWEIGHVAWFQERWVLRHHAGRPPLRADGDALYDSATVPHDVRWDLPLPSRAETLRYLDRVRERVLEQIALEEPSAELTYFCLLSIFHEDMHDEAITYTRQTHGYPPPRFAPGTSRRADEPGGPWPGDCSVAGGEYCLGATADQPFVFDNEKWEHRVSVPPFAIARAPVTNAEFAAFVEDGGYRRPELWDAGARPWLESLGGAVHPVYWCRDGGPTWLRRHFDRLVTLEPHHPVIHVSWYEADAYCRWAGRRLPAEAEWELAGSAKPGPDGASFTTCKQRFPWGDEAPTASRANLDWASLGCLPVDALPEGDSAFGCRQMIGNVWEWTASDFGPYPGFVADPYREYSEPWFQGHKVLRGGAWTTRGRLLRNTWRNFYPPHRRDVWAGFRSVAPLR